MRKFTAHLVGFMLLMAGFSPLAHAQLSGTYTIGGTSPDYTNFASAVSALTSQGVSGPVTFNVRNGLYNEQVSIGTVAGASSVNNITFQSQSGDSTQVVLYFGASSSSSNYTLRYYGCDYLTFHQITIQATGTSYGTGVRIDNGSSNCAVTNCLITSPTTTTTSANLSVVYLNSGNNDFTLLNSDLRNGSRGFYVPSTTTGLLIQGNKITDSYSNGALLGYTHGVQFLENEISSSTSSTSYIGLYLQYADQDIQVYRNKINIVNGSHGIYYYYCDGTSSLRGKSRNNFVTLGGGSGTGYAIYQYRCTYHDWEYNSVHNYRTSGSQYAYFQNSSSSYPQTNFLNNIFDGGNGYAFYVNSPSSIVTSNYNDLYSSGTNLGYWSGNRTSLSAWQSASGKDANSISTDPVFVSNTDLHTFNYLLDGKATPIAGVSIDIDGNTRSGSTPDIGADEFVPPATDAGISDIPTLSLCDGIDTVYVTLTNYGTDTLDSATINWSVNGIPQTAYSWVGTLAQGQSMTSIALGAYNFNPGTQYTIFASTANPNGATDQQTGNDSYQVSNQFAAMSGTYTIGGTSPDFATINAAATAMEQGGICGPVVMNIRDGIYNEQVSFDQVAGVSATNTIIYQSQSGDSSQVVMTFSSGSQNYVARLNGVDYLTFKQISIHATNTSYGRAISAISSADFITVENCVLQGPSVSTTSANPAVFYAPSGTDNLTIKNSRILNGSMGIYLQGTSSNNVFTGNEFSGQYYMGAYLYRLPSVVFEDNEIQSATAYTSYFGIYTYDCDSDISIKRNKVTITNSGRYGMYFYLCNGNSSNRQVIANNMVAMGGSGTKYGIQTYQSSYQNYYHNTSRITATSGTRYAYHQDLSSGSSNLNLQNNIFDGGTGYAMYIEQTSSIASSNFNNLYSNGTYLGYWSGNRTNLSAWQSASGQDGQSVSIDPIFLSATDLHVTNYQVNNQGTPVAGITVDIDGETRSLTNPDIGADEFTPPANDAGITDVSSLLSLCASSDSVYVTLKNFGSSTLTTVSINWTVNGVLQTPYAWSGSLAQGASEGPFSIGFFNFGLGVPYSITATTSNPNGSADGLTFNDASSISNTYQSLSGTYTIGGTSPDFTSIDAAATALEQGGVCGPVVMDIRDGVYNEQVSFDPVAGVSATNTITFQGENGDSTLVSMTFSSGSVNYVARLNGIDYLTIRHITINATNTSYGRAINMNSSPDNCRIENCVLQGPTASSTSSNLAIVYGPSGTDDFEMHNNRIVNGSMGVYLQGTSSGNVFTGNRFENQYYMGAYLYRLPSVDFTENYITSNTNYTGYYGIYLYDSDGDIKIRKNQVYVNGSGRYGIYSYLCNGSSSLRQDYSNNMVSMNGSGTKYGIQVYQCSFQNIFYNSVQITATSGTRYAFHQDLSSGSSNLNIQNNVFNGGTGYAMYIEQTSSIANSNYNNLYSNGTYIGYWSGNRTNLSAWQSASSQDAQSVSIDPIFTSSTDLHLQNYLLDNLGFPVAGITDDLDGDTRSLTNPDMGADEFTTPVNDAGITSIDQTLSLCSTSDSVYVTLKNFGSANLTSVTINWTVNGVPQTPYAWTGNLAQGASEGPFSIGFYNFGLGTPYTITAFTSAPNGGSEGFAYNDQSNITTTYQAMSGTYTIGGTSPDYANFNAAVTDLVNGGVCGPVVFDVRDGIYNEQVSISSVAGTSPTNTVTFQSQSGDSTLVILTFTPGSSNNYTLRLIGADYTTFREMTLRGIGTSYARVVNLEGSSQNCSLESCVLEGSVTSSTSTNLSVVYEGSGTNSPFLMENCWLKNGSAGYFTQGTLNDIVIRNNKFENQYIYGAYLYRLPGLIFEGNEISSNTAYSSYYGAYFYDSDNQLIVRKNRVNITGNGAFGLYFYLCNGSSGTRQDISNNMVSMGGSGSKYGIRTYQSSYQNLFYNSVYITATSGTRYAYHQDLSSGSSNLNLQNNIFHGGGGYAIYIEQTSSIASSDYNDLYTTGSILGYWSGNRTNLSAWQSASSRDANSLSLDPLFVSNSDLHLQNYLMDNFGFPVAGITDDIDGEARNVLTPDMGADEFTTPVNDAGVTSIDQNLSLCSTSDSVYVTIKNYGTAPLTSVTINWSVNGTPQTPYNWTGNLNQGASQGPFAIGQFNFGLGTPYTISATTVNPNGSPEGFAYNDQATISNTYQAMSGNYTIGGTSPDYANFNAAVTDLVNGGVCGPVVFDVRSGVYNEQFSIGTIDGVSAVNTVTFQSQALDSTQVIVTWTPSSGSNYVVRMAGADYVTLHKMNIRSIGTSYARAVEVFSSSQNITLSNNILEGSSTSSSSSNLAVVYAASSFNDLKITNNRVLKGSTGLYLSGSNSTGVEVSGNEIYDSYIYGMYAYRLNSMEFSDNLVTSNTNSSSFAGGYFSDCDNNLKVTGNDMRILNGLRGMIFYLCNGSSSQRQDISNNFVSLGGSSGTGRGIELYQSSYQNYFYNSVNIYRTSGTRYAFHQDLSSGSSQIVLQNNIFDGGSGYAMYIEQTSSIAASDYNSLYTSGTNIGYWAGNRSTLAVWRSASNKDANSVNVNPNFVSNTDLHTCDTGLDGKGLPTGTVTVDIDGGPRNILSPDIGADEFVSVVSVNLGADTTVCDTLFLDPGFSGSNFLWSNGATSQVIPVTNSGLYWVDVTNACGTDRDTIVVTTQPFLNVNLGADTNICAGGSIILDAGNPGSSYSWSNSAVTQSISVNSSGTYYVNVTKSGCSGTDTVNVGVVSIPVAGFSTTGSTTFCAGGSVVFTSDSTSGNQWYLNGNPISGANGQTLTATTSGTYSLEVSNGACSDFSGNVSVTVNPLPSANAGPDVTICAGGSTGLSASGGNSYAWSPATGLSSTTASNPSATPNATTTYTVTVTGANGCTATDDVVVTVNPKPNANAGPDVTITSGNSTTLTGTATGGTGSMTYFWNPGGFNGQFYTVTPPTTTTYVLTIVDGAGCTDSDTVTVTVGGNPVTVTASADTSVCLGDDATLSASAIGGTGSYSYNWMPGNFNGSLYLVNPTTTTKYYVTATDNGNGQTSLDSVTVVVNSLPSASAGPDAAVCSGTSANLSGSGSGGSGSYSYAWNPGNLSGTNVSVSPTVTTDYALTVTDGNGCSGTDTVNITVNSNPVANAGTNQSVCQGDTATLGGAATGGNGSYTYVWNPGSVAGPNINVVPSLTSSYTLTVTDGNGCVDTDQTTISVNATPVANAGADQNVCSGTTVNLSGSASGGTGSLSYTWNPGSLSGSGVSVTPSATTTYTLFVSDANNCSGSDDVVITVNQAPVANAGPDQGGCSGTAVTLSGSATGGSGNLTYSWNPGGLPGQTVAVNPSVTTTYTLTVQDGSGCIGTDQVVVAVGAPISVNAGADVSVCAGDAVNLSGIGAGGNGSLSYSWNPGGISGSSVSVSPTSTTTYVLTASDTAGCTGTDDVIVTVNATPAANAGADQSICSGDNATLSGIGAGGTGTLTYTWNPGNLNGQSVSVSPTATTNYVMGVSDANGCSDTDTLTVTVNPNPTSGFSFTTNLLTATFADASTNATAWSWDFGDGNTSTQQNPTHTYGPDGTFQVCLKVTSADGCEDNFCDSVTVSKVGLFENLIGASLQVYPNPNQGKFTVEFNLDHAREIGFEVIDLRGVKVFDRPMDMQSGFVKEQINLDHVASGVYFLRIRSTEGQVIRKVVKE